jgi:hypothetical protein
MKNMNCCRYKNGIEFCITEHTGNIIGDTTRGGSGAPVATGFRPWWKPRFIIQNRVEISRRAEQY